MHEIANKHQLAIARRTLRLHCIGARILGGPNHAEAVLIIKRLTGKEPKLPDECTCKPSPSGVG
jgi:hypothetical protein